VNFPIDGEWRFTASIAELSGYKLPLQVDLVGTPAEGGGGVLNTLALRAIAPDGVTVSEVLANLADIQVGPDGAFEAAFENVTLPGAFTVTGSDVLVSVVFDGQVRGTDFICGLVTGEIITLAQALTMSTFGGVPAANAGENPPFSCDSQGGGGDLPRIAAEACPILAAGVNTFTSAENEREFRVYLPSGVGGETPSPVIFLWHGLGQPIDEIEDMSNLEAFVEEYQFILVVPESLALPVEWDQLTSADNVDLAFFDDMLTCLDNSFNVDEERVYTSGLSAGALWSTYLTVFRAEKLAASALFSGGLLVPYPEPVKKRPVLVAWGGVEDIAFEQNFDTFAHDLEDNLVPAGHFFVGCNHNAGHTWEPEFSPWALDFLFAHTLSTGESPLAAGLPESFPEFCTIGGLP
jgi:predicted esterase